MIDRSMALCFQAIGIQEGSLNFYLHEGVMGAIINLQLEGAPDDWIYEIIIQLHHQNLRLNPRRVREVIKSPRKLRQYCRRLALERPLDFRHVGTVVGYHSANAFFRT